MTESFQRLEPPFLYGTAWKEDETTELTELAIECGFRGIDTANQRKHYHEAAVGDALGAALESGRVERDDLFVQTKFTHAPGQDERIPYDEDADFATQVEQSFESSLDHLGIDFIDSYVLHGPMAHRGVSEPDREVWERMEALLETGRVGAIGVSNFAPGQLEKLLEWADHPPATVQNRCFARTGWDRKVRSICDANDIVYQGFSLLTANARELRASDIGEIAANHERTIPQIVFRFARHVDILPLTGTTSETHMRQDLAIFDFELDDEEVETLASIATR